MRTYQALTHTHTHTQTHTHTAAVVGLDDIYIISRTTTRTHTHTQTHTLTAAVVRHDGIYIISRTTTHTHTHTHRPHVSVSVSSPLLQNIPVSHRPHVSGPVKECVSGVGGLFQDTRTAKEGRREPYRTARDP